MYIVNTLRDTARLFVVPHER